MKRLVAAILLAVVVSACGGSDNSPTSPSSPTPTTPTPTPVTVTGVRITGTGCAPEFVAHACAAPAIGGTLQLTAIADKSDGSTQDVTTVATWASTSTAVATITSGGLVTIKKPGAVSFTAVYQGKMGGQTVNVNPPIWTKSGSGDSVFDMPTYISRVHITGTYPGSSSNFIVHIGGQYLVNVIIGTSSWADARSYDGTLLTIGGTVEIVHSTGVAWTFTEVR